MNLKTSLLFVIVSAVVFVSISPADEKQNLSGDLVIFHAGSLSLPFREIGLAFMEAHPAVTVRAEAAGSRACARKIIDLGRRCDVMASADYEVIEALLIPGHADWCIKFAANEMTIVYQTGSNRAGEIDAGNWFEILLDGDVRFGRSDPNVDPCGYRSVLTMKLAEKHYGREGLAARLLAKDLRYIRPKETDLLALLEMGEIDYIFLYRSVSAQHGLKTFLLPDEVNLKRADLADLYVTVTVDISGKRPGETITRAGAPMVYGITIPKNAPNAAAAIEFVRFVLEKDQGMAIMECNGQPSVVPSPSATWERIPEALKPFVSPAR